MKTIHRLVPLDVALACGLAFNSARAAKVTPAEASVIAKDVYIITYLPPSCGCTSRANPNKPANGKRPHSNG